MNRFAAVRHAVTRAGFGLWMVLLGASLCQADTYLVPDDYETIQEAVDEAVDGDVIEVEAGTYVENIDVGDKAIIIRSRGDATDTTIDGIDVTLGTDRGSVLSFAGTAGDGAIIEGFTITSGSGTSYTYDVTGSSFVGGGAVFAVDAVVTLRGCVIEDNVNGGIHAREGCTLTVEDCVIADNVGVGIIVLIDGSLTITDSVIEGNGDLGFETGGVSSGSGCSAVIENCEFIDNDGFVGGGASVQDDSEIRDCTFIGNSASFAGALYVGEGSTVERCSFIDNEAGVSAGVLSEGDTSFRYCLFHGNESDGSGGALSSESMGDPIRVEHCTIVGNSAVAGAAVWISDTPLPSDVEFELLNCIIWDNGDELFEDGESTIGIDYSDVDGGYDGFGIIDEDPEFVDEEAGDFRLAVGSPCIDAGDPVTLDADGTIADLGAFPYVPMFRRGDVDGNGAVSAIVDSLVLMQWAFQFEDDPPCFDAADVDDSGDVSALLEIIALLRYAFADGQEPPSPGVSTCGPDPTPDLVSCETPPDCG